MSTKIHIILGAGVRVTQTEVESVTKYLEGAGLTGFWCLGPLEGSGKPDVYVYPCDEEGTRDKKRRKLLPNKVGDKANVRAIGTVLAMVGGAKAVAPQPVRTAPVVIPLEDEGPVAAPSEPAVEEQSTTSGDDESWQEDEALLNRLLGLSKPTEAVAAFIGLKEDEPVGFEPAWDIFDCGG